MNSNILYDVVQDNNYNFLEQQKQINFKNGCISYSSNVLNIYINRVHKQISINNIVINDVFYNDEKVYILFNNSVNTYVFYYDGVSSKCYTIFGKVYNNAFICVERDMYILTDNYIHTIISSSASTIANDSIIADKYCTTTLSESYKIDCIASKFFIYDENVIIPKQYKYVIYNTVNKKITSIENNIDSNINEFIQLGEKTDYSKEGIITIYSSGTSLYICDNDDMNEYILHEFDSCPKFIYSDNFIYVLADNNLYEIDKSDYEIYKLYTTSIINSNRVCITDSIKYISDNVYSFVEYTGRSSTLNIVCVNDDGLPIHSDVMLLKYGETVSINAPAIDGYYPTEITKNIECIDDNCYATFSYIFTKEMHIVNIKCVCGATTISEYTISGPDGAEYFVDPIDIDGYLFFRSENDYGIYGSNTPCILEYISINTETTATINTVKVKAIVNDSVFITRYVNVTKSDISIIPPTINGLSTVNDSISIINTYNLQTVECIYTKLYSNVIPVQFVYNGNVLYETSCVIKGQNLFIEDMTKILDYNIPEYNDLENEALIVIQCVPRINITMYDIRNNNNLYTYCIFNNSDLYVPSIENNTFVDYSIQNYGKLKIYNLQYTQNIITMHFKHIIQSYLYHEEYHTGSYGDIVIVPKLDTHLYDYTGDTMHNFGYSDRTIIYNYCPTIIQISINIKNLNNDIVSSYTYNFNLDDEQKVNIHIDNRYKLLYQDTDVNKDVILTFTESKSLNYIVFDKFKTLTSHKYNIGEAIAFTPTNNPYSFPVSSTNILINNIYVIYNGSTDISGTINILNDNNIEHNIISPEEIYSVPIGSVIINGDIISKINSINSIHINDRIILDADIEYKNIINTIKLAIKNSIKTIIAIKQSSINANIEIDKIRYNKVSKNVYIDLDIEQKHSDYYSCIEYDIYDIKNCEIKHSYKYNIYTATKLTKCYYNLDDDISSSVVISQYNNINNIKYSTELPSNNIIEKYLHIIFEDDIGNRTPQYDIFIAHKATPVSTINSFNKVELSSSSIRYNNRYNGPRESYKLYNTYASIEKDINNINNSLNEINKIVGELSFDI